MSETLGIQTPLYSWKNERIGESMRKFLMRRKAMIACQPKDSSLTVPKGKHSCVPSTSYLVVLQVSNSMATQWKCVVTADYRFSVGLRERFVVCSC